MSRRVLAVVLRGAASTEQVTRKLSMMTSMGIGLCKRRLDEVDKVGILAWRSKVGLSCRGSPVGKAAEHERCPLFASVGEELSGCVGLGSARSCAPPTHLQWPSSVPVGQRAAPPLFSALWWCVSDRDGAPLVFCPSRESSLPATPRCAATSAFVLHDTTVRVGLDPKWQRWSWCVEGGR